MGLRRGRKGAAVVIGVGGNDRTHGADGTNGLVGRVPNWGSALPGGLWGRGWVGEAAYAKMRGDRGMNGEWSTSRLL